MHDFPLNRGFLPGILPVSHKGLINKLPSCWSRCLAQQRRIKMTGPVPTFEGGFFKNKFNFRLAALTRVGRTDRPHSALSNVAVDVSRFPCPLYIPLPYNARFPVLNFRELIPFFTLSLFMFLLGVRWIPETSPSRKTARDFCQVCVGREGRCQVYDVG